MVMVANIDEALEMAGHKKSRYGEPRPGDGMNPLDAAMLGAAVIRLEIPLVADKHAMRRICEILRGYLNHIDVLSREPGISERTLLMETKAQGRLVNQKLRQTAGRDVYSGRPSTKSELRAQRLARGRTVKDD